MNHGNEAADVALNVTLQSSCIPANPFSVQGAAGAGTARGDMLGEVEYWPLFAEGEVVQRRVLGKQLAFATLKCDDRGGLLEVRGASRAQIAKRRRGGSRTIIRFLSRSPSLPKTLSELKGVPILKMKLLVPGYPFRCAKSLKTCISDLCIPPTIAGQTAPWSF